MLPYIRIANGHDGATVNGISADGSVAVGWSGSTGGARSFRWNTATGALRYLDQAINNRPRVEKVSGDGSIIVGKYDIANDITQAFRWTAADGIQNLGTLAGNDSSAAHDISVDGSIIVGETSLSSDPWTQRAFRWTAATGMQALPLPAGGIKSIAYGVNADGSVVVGEFDTDSSKRAFRWTLASGAMRDIGTLPGSNDARATVVNADGSFVAGESRFDVQISALDVDDRMSEFGEFDVDDPLLLPDMITTYEWRAFRWSAATGTMRALGALDGGSESSSLGISADGSVIVGTARSGSGWQGFRWTEATGMISVEDWLRNNGIAVASDFTGSANGVSADGNIIVGQTRNNTPYIARIVLAVPAAPENNGSPGPNTPQRENNSSSNTGTPAHPATSTDTTETDRQEPTASTRSGTASTSSVASAAPSPVASAAPSPAASAATSPAAPAALPDKPAHPVVPALSGIIDLGQYARTLAARPNAGIGLDIANTLLDGAHGAPMRNLLEPGRQSFSVVSDIGYDDGRGSAGGFGIADIAYGIGLEGGATARLALAVFTTSAISTPVATSSTGAPISPPRSACRSPGAFTPPLAVIMHPAGCRSSAVTSMAAPWTIRAARPILTYGRRSCASTGSMPLPSANGT